MRFKNMLGHSFASTSALKRTRGQLLWLGTLVCLVAAVPIRAEEFALLNGTVYGDWKNTLVMGVGIRNGKQQAALIGAGAAVSGEFPGASNAIAVVDDPDLNFRQGDVVSAPVTLVSDLRLQYKASGIFVRVRMWFDVALETKKVPHGNPGNLYTHNKLSDDNFVGAGKFAGADVQDAFLYTNFKVAGQRVLLRFGRQVINWGEGLLYPGINAFNPGDYAWAVMPGATPSSGGYLPVNRTYLNIALPRGFTLDGFYNLEWRSDVFPGCGTWYSFVDNGFQPGCNTIVSAGSPDQVVQNGGALKSYWGGKLPASGPFPYGAPDNPAASKEPSAWGQYGIGAHYFAEPIKSEIGVFYTTFKSHFPTISALPGSQSTPADIFAVNNMWAGSQQAAAVSLATGIRRLTINSEVTRIWGVPGQRNFPTMIQGLFQNAGPYTSIQNYIGKEFPGYIKLNTTQFQFGGSAQIGQYFHMSDLQVTAETNMMWATNLPGLDRERILRWGGWGYASFGPNGDCNPSPQPNHIVNKCEVAGFATPFNMGYRFRLNATLPQFGPGITVTPVFAFNQDVTGHAVDGTMIGGRVNFAATVRWDWRQRYFVDTGVTWYRRGTTWDPLRDSGLYLLALGVRL